MREEKGFASDLEDLRKVANDSEIVVISRGFAKELLDKMEELEKTNKENYWVATDFKYENLVLEQQNRRYREAIRGVQDILESENWSDYEATALQDNILDFITLENSDLLEEEK